MNLCIKKKILHVYINYLCRYNVRPIIYIYIKQGIISTRNNYLTRNLKNKKNRATKSPEMFVKLNKEKM